jgi:hypothetical protein
VTLLVADEHIAGTYGAAVLQCSHVDIVVRPASRSPWITIWTDPRGTIRRVVTAPSRPSWRPVVVLALVGRAFAWLVANASGVDLSLSVLRAAMDFALILYWIGIVPFFLAFVGKWGGDNAESSVIRQAIAWSYVPDAVARLSIPLAAAYLLARPDANISALDANLAQTIKVGQVWSLVIMIGTLAEVQQRQRLAASFTIACIVVVSIPPLLLLLLLVRLQS